MKKQLTKRQRRKELTGINLAAIHRRLSGLEEWVVIFDCWIQSILKNTHAPLALQNYREHILGNEPKRKGKKS